jgi:hypothetical protein
MIAVTPSSVPSSSRQEQTGKAIRLGAVSNFGQGWTEESYSAVQRFRISRLRDSIRWAEVERTPGRYVFNGRKSAWPDRFQAENVKITLTLAGGNPLYDGGNTPHSPAALAAFGRFAAAVVKRYPQIDTVEIGNEFNSGNFVSGPVKTDGLARRAQHHLAILEAVAAAVRKVRPGISVIGGSSHSIAAGYLWPLLERPESRLMDGLAMHPYTTDIDQLPRQIEFLKRDPHAAKLPLFITEFGSEDRVLAADDLVRGYVTLASTGAAEFDWYPLNERGDGLVPLVRKDGTVTKAGQAFLFVQSNMRGMPVQDISPDEFTFVRRIGNKMLALWGAPRDVRLARRDITASDATGAKLDPSRLHLEEGRALILTSESPINFASDVKLGCNPLIADSFYQFSYAQPGTASKRSGFIRSVRIGKEDFPLSVMEGQQKPGVPWTPYLGRSNLVSLQLHPGMMVPAFGAKGGAIIHRLMTESPADVRVRAIFTPVGTGDNEIIVTVAHAGESIVSKSGKGPIKLDISVALRKGESVLLSAVQSENSNSGKFRYRIQALDEHRCPALPPELDLPPN